MKVTAERLNVSTVDVSFWVNLATVPNLAPTLFVTREELREGLLGITEGAMNGVSLGGLRKECRKRRNSSAAKIREEKERYDTLDLCPHRVKAVPICTHS